ncbi:MAG TPA: zinc ribbon domain-containing protein [Candidatus Angelobacter sp.]|nr:zinc ribbon domain-containing protein [Candidatus Angelobacter sp.]
MKCTFCGSGNRPENRFCGMCGVRIERRQQERRTSQAGNLKCAACSHLNEIGQKFCGMCGTRIERRVKERRGSGMPGKVPAGESPGRAVAQANAQLPSPEMASASPDGPRARAVTPAPAVLNQMERAQPPAVVRSREQYGSTIGGPSFLGLNSEPQNEGEYLLEDESSSRSGLRKLVLLVVLLAIAGLIFVQWRASYHANPKSLEPPKPAPATVPRPQGKNLPLPANTQENDAANDTNQTGINQKTDQDAKIKDDAKTQDAGTQDTQTSGARSKTTTAAEGTAGQSSKEEKQVALTGKRAPAKSAGDAQDRNASDEASDKSQGQSEVQKRRGEPASRDKPSIALVRAQRYLQGRGVPQNCEQGMMYLKAATQQNDPNAAVQMAALYASGHCVQQDRVKAYQWFSSAYSQEPGNQWIAKNMNQLWGQMTPQQRRQFQ